MEWLQVESIVSYGIFASLFVWLLHTTNKRNEARENKYQEVIAKQATAFTHMSSDIKEIKYILRKDREK